VAYFAASADNAQTNRRFAESLELDYPILSDPSKDTARAFGVVGGLLPWPSRWTFYIGTDGRVLYVDRDIKTKTAGADIAARLTALGVARRPVR
jgi:peroxiredoxin Q/BCP